MGQNVFVTFEGDPMGTICFSEGNGKFDLLLLCGRGAYENKIAVRNYSKWRAHFHNFIIIFRQPYTPQKEQP